MFLGATLWGTGMHESIIPAAVSPIMVQSKRASAFGPFTAVYGLYGIAGSASWLDLRSLGDLIRGVLCDYTGKRDTGFYLDEPASREGLNGMKRSRTPFAIGPPTDFHHLESLAGDSDALEPDQQSRHVIESSPKWCRWTSPTCEYEMRHLPATN
ncbi:hypothetical protein [Caballeronia sp. LjRoot31]|uniref:hypothetical protein n=1 Tax=Caballeronia sp. LjRoot31 TaxID=3342324 RepID=UPI003ECC2946